MPAVFKPDSNAQLLVRVAGNPAAPAMMPSFNERPRGRGGSCAQKANSPTLQASSLQARTAVERSVVSQPERFVAGRITDPRTWQRQLPRLLSYWSPSTFRTALYHRYGCVCFSEGTRAWHTYETRGIAVTLPSSLRHHRCRPCQPTSVSTHVSPQT